MSIKKCYKCEYTKDLEHFGKCKRNTDGLQSICLVCKRDYDKKRAAVLYDNFKIKRFEVMLKISKCCEVCEKETEVGFHLHHKVYHETESNYPTHAKSMSVRIKRVEEASKNPERFSVLCPKCHLLVECVKDSGISISKLEPFIK